ncbi:MAG: YdcH family protein [Pseudomonadota bacterium]
MMDREAILQAQHAALVAEHRALDGEIKSIEEDRPHDQLTLRRLKKQKLALKDRIARLEDQITPDIIA